jgi:HAD superfamily hydrolase (TIGR01509 family)
MGLRALIFDVDGTLAETEELHRLAFNRAFEEAGLSWHWDQPLYARLLKVTGGRERIEAYAGEIGAAGIDAAALHTAKTAFYKTAMEDSAIRLRAGVEWLIQFGLDNSLALAVATTTSRSNVEALFRATLGLGLLGRFRSVRTGEDVRVKKPDPEVYRLVLDDLGFAAVDCVAFEDSANGLKAAKALGIPTVITPGIYTADDDFTGADCVLDDLGLLFEQTGTFPENCPSCLPDLLEGTRRCVPA